MEEAASLRGSFKNPCQHFQLASLWWMEQRRLKQLSCEIILANSILTAKRWRAGDKLAFRFLYWGRIYANMYSQHFFSIFLNHAVAREQGLLYHIRSVKHAAVSASWTRHWLTMARGTMPARSSCASRISVSTSCVALRLAGYSTCQAIQRLPSGSGKFSIFKSTWSTRRKPISNLPEHRRSRIEGVNDAMHVCVCASLWQQSIKARKCVFCCEVWNF